MGVTGIHPHARTSVVPEALGGARRGGGGGIWGGWGLTPGTLTARADAPNVDIDTPTNKQTNKEVSTPWTTPISAPLASQSAASLWAA
ncbi:hypothetical protein GCM10009868_25570 [Terrabacter aerolatus]